MRPSAMLLIATDDDRILLHLRDDKPGILHPGCWAGFGGAIEDGESPEDAVLREVEEETGLRIEAPIYLCEEIDEGEGRRDPVTLYYVRGGITPDQIDLHEGAAVGVHDRADLDHLRLAPFVRRAILDHLLPLLADSRP